MKVANIINVILQGLGFLGTIIAMILGYFEKEADNYTFRDVAGSESIISLVALIFLGGYQLIHALVISILKSVRKEFNRLFSIYWILIVLYINSVVVLLGIINVHYFSDNMFFICVFLAWIPVIYYFIISIVDLVKALKK